MKRINALAPVAGALAAATARPAAAQASEAVTVSAVNSVADTPILIDMRFVDQANAVLGARR